MPCIVTIFRTMLSTFKKEEGNQINLSCLYHYRLHCGKSVKRIRNILIYSKLLIEFSIKIRTRVSFLTIQTYHSTEDIHFAESCIKNTQRHGKIPETVEFISKNKLYSSPNIFRMQWHSWEFFGA
jgi:hypothetical protein